MVCSTSHARLKIEGTPFAGMLLEAGGGETLMGRAVRMAAGTALANGGEQLLFEDADPSWARVDLADGVVAPHKALRFASNTCLWVTATVKVLN